MTHRRLVVPGLPHHIIHRGNNRRIIASFAFDFCRLLRLMSDSALATGCAVFAGAILSNHLHLIVVPPQEASLPRFVRLWAQRYARRRNRERGGSGKLFEERYTCRPLKDDAALAAVTRYIDLNPVVAGCASRPEAYRWSTAALHLGRARTDWPLQLWQPSPWYLSLGADAEARSGAYRDWLDDGSSGTSVATAGADEAAHSWLHFTRRLRRPDGTTARDVAAEPHGRDG